jgi:hypothetical protein
MAAPDYNYVLMYPTINVEACLSIDYLILRPGLFDDSYVGRVIFFTSISEKA